MIQNEVSKLVEASPIQMFKALKWSEVSTEVLRTIIKQNFAILSKPFAAMGLFLQTSFCRSSNTNPCERVALASEGWGLGAVKKTSIHKIIKI